MTWTRVAISNAFSTPSLVELFRFDKLLHNIAKAKPDCKLLVCAGIDPQQQIAISFMLACHLIMSGSLGFEEACLAFQPLLEQVSSYIDTAAFKNALRAICCAKCMGWIDFRSDEEKVTQKPGSIEMDEYIHYSRYAHIQAQCDSPCMIQRSAKPV